MGTVSTKEEVVIPGQHEGFLSPMQIAEVEHKAVLQSTDGRRYCKRPHDVWEMCMLNATETSSCADYAKDASACVTILMIQTTMLACADEIETCRAAADDSMDTNNKHVVSAYQQEIERRFLPCVKHHLKNKQYPESVYPGGSKSAVPIAVSAMKKLDKNQNDKLLDIVGPLLRSDYDKATASFRDATSAKD